MAKTRALMTQTERDRIAGREDVEDIKRYQAISRVRRRIEEELTEDVLILEEHHEGLLDELREVVCADAESPAESAATPSEPEPAPEPEADDAARDGPPKRPDGLAPGEGLPETPLSDDQEAMLRERLAGSGDRLDGRVDAVRRMYDRLRTLGEATRGDLLNVVDVDATGYAHADSVWSNVVKGKDTLAALPGAEKPASGMSTWRYDPEAANE